MKHFLLAWLERKGWSQAELARRLGVPRSQVNDWIKGRRPPPCDIAVTIETLSDGAVKRDAWPARPKRKTPTEVLLAHLAARQAIAASEAADRSTVTITVAQMCTILDAAVNR